MICKCCGKEFTKTKNNQKYCSPECKANAEREQRQNHYLKHQAKKKAQRQAVAAVKNGWLTIPNAPNYEISSDLQVRNKKTGKLMKQFFQPRMTTPAVSLYYNGKSRNVYLKSARCKAEAAALTEIGDEWFLVPSLDNQYEFNNKNQLRHSKSKKLLRRRQSNPAYTVKVSNKIKTISIVALRWEIFGDNPPKNIPGVKKPVIINKGLTTRYFDRRMDAARFIAAENFYSVNYIAHLFSRRQTQIFGWTINYLENEITQVGDYLKGMQTKDPRQAKKK